MKALILTREYPPNVYGGAGMHVAELTRELRSRIAVEVRAFGDQDEEADGWRVRGYPRVPSRGGDEKLRPAWEAFARDLASLAVDPLQRSVEKDPSNPLYRYHLGLAYLKVGDKVKARASLEQALKLKSDFEGAPEARKVLASIQG